MVLVASAFFAVVGVVGIVVDVVGVVDVFGIADVLGAVEAVAIVVLVPSAFVDPFVVFDAVLAIRYCCSSFASFPFTFVSHIFLFLVAALRI